MPNHKSKIIQAIKEFDVKKLSELLDDDKIYMDVPKSRFIASLEDCFTTVGFKGCKGFNDVFFGVCQGCNRGCEAVTFISEEGFYLDLFLSGEEKVEDIYVCNHLTNFFELNKKYNLFLERFIYDDDKVNFVPSITYINTIAKYNRIQKEIDDLGPVKKLTDIFEILNRQENSISKEDLDSDQIIKSRDFGYLTYFNLELEQLLNVQREADRAVDGVLSFYETRHLVERLTWFFENENITGYFSSFHVEENTTSKVPNIIPFGSERFQLDISGYEYVIEYFRIHSFLKKHLMELFEPLPEHNTEGLVLEHLTDYLYLHDVYPHLVRKYSTRREYHDEFDSWTDEDWDRYSL